MKSINLFKLAAVSAVALTIGLSGQNALAAPFEMDGGVPYEVDVTADVDNTADLAITDVAFGTLGVTSDAVDTATMVMLPDGSITDDLDGGLGLNEAHLVSETDAGTAGVATFAGLADTQVFVYYSNPSDLACATAGCAGSPDLILEQIQDDLADTAGSFTASTATAVTGVGTTDGTGALTWNIGATIETIATALQYETGTYEGTFDVLMSY